MKSFKSFLGLFLVCMCFNVANGTKGHTPMSPRELHKIPAEDLGRQIYNNYTTHKDVGQELMTKKPIEIHSALSNMNTETAKTVLSTIPTNKLQEMHTNMVSERQKTETPANTSEVKIFEELNKRSDVLDKSKPFVKSGYSALDEEARQREEADTLPPSDEQSKSVEAKNIAEKNKAAEEKAIEVKKAITELAKIKVGFFKKFGEEKAERLINEILKADPSINFKMYTKYLVQQIAQNKKMSKQDLEEKSIYYNKDITSLDKNAHTAWDKEAWNNKTNRLRMERKLIEAELLIRKNTKK